MEWINKISKFYSALFFLPLLCLFIGTKIRTSQDDIRSQLVASYINLLEREIGISEKLQNGAISSNDTEIVFEIQELKQEVLRLINLPANRSKVNALKKRLQHIF